MSEKQREIVLAKLQRVKQLSAEFWQAQEKIDKEIAQLGAAVLPDKTGTKKRRSWPHWRVGR